ncbi:hypothetical protein KORDIASMS9_03851 [Kordia sp. SMS9]|uniref:hypothetical protein n=1 Tax=Kordia sp. SMS9 TaxID=2282170 RepID=UPI000E0CF59D|nr:hypothetical protein [Kordia sp. SMS9]AXG71594.1 hypothetical protein KORDIASMS9_03851 [Kordia sp. SMS9]
MFEKLKKLSRLDILEIILTLITFVTIMEMLNRHTPSLNYGIAFATCVISIVWIEITKVKLQHDFLRQKNISDEVPT